MYTEEEIKERIKEFSDRYKIGDIRIKDYYYILCKYPIFKKDDQGLYCLEKVCQTRALSSEELKDKTVRKTYRHTVEYAINDALYNTYKNKKLDYLSDSYINEKNITIKLKLTNM